MTHHTKFLRILFLRSEEICWQFVVHSEYGNESSMHEDVIVCKLQPFGRNALLQREGDQSKAACTTQSLAKFRGQRVQS